MAPTGDTRTALLTLEKVAVGYGRHRVLSDVNLTIHSDEFWVFLGPNGRGKTTLLRAILGCGCTLAGSLRRDPSATFGFAPQSSSVNRRLPTTVREFTVAGAAGLKLCKGECQQRLLQVLETVGLEHRSQAAIGTLSGGELRRAIVARALLRKPRLLVLDEPASGLDIAAAASLYDLLQSLHQQRHLAVLMVTHNLHTARHLGTHAAMFRNGGVTSGEIGIVNDASVSESFGVSLDVAARLLDCGATHG